MAEQKEEEEGVIGEGGYRRGVWRVGYRRGYETVDEAGVPQVLMVVVRGVCLRSGSGRE